MGWDCYAKPAKSRSDPLWREVADAVASCAGSCDGDLSEGGLDVSTCGTALADATKRDIYGDDWSASEVAEMAKDANWGDYAVLDYSAWSWLWWLGQAGTLIAVFMLVVGFPNPVKALIQSAVLSTESHLSFNPTSRAVDVGNSCHEKQTMVILYKRLSACAIPDLRAIDKRKLPVLAGFDASNIGNIAGKLSRVKHEERISSRLHKIESDVTFGHPTNRRADISDDVLNGYSRFERVGYQRESFAQDQLRAMSGNELLVTEFNSTTSQSRLFVGRSPERERKSGNSDRSEGSPYLWLERVKSFNARDYNALAGGAIIVIGSLIICLCAVGADAAWGQKQ